MLHWNPQRFESWQSAVLLDFPHVVDRSTGPRDDSSKELTDMSMTLDQIIAEAHRLPREQIAELVDSLTLELHQSIDPSLENAWKLETRRRLTEIESGSVKGVPGEEVSARIGKIVGR